MSFVKLYLIVFWTLLIFDIIVLTPGVQLFGKRLGFYGIKASGKGEPRSSNLFEIETLVLLDSSLEKSLKDSSKTSVEGYIQIFFHAVNQIFIKSHANDHSFPTISVKVVDIKVLPEDTESFIFKPVDPSDPFTIDIEKSLMRFKSLAGKGRKYDKYDHVMLLTGRDLYRADQGIYKPDVLGVAFLAGACSKVETDGKYKSLSIVEDRGGLFLGVYPAAHELTHNMATKHDSVKPNADPECKAKSGYIMSPQTSQTDNMFQFSHCSLESLRTFLHSEQGNCLTKSDFKPVFPEDSAPVKLPGEMYSMQEICECLASLDFENEVQLGAIVNPNKSPDALCRQISCQVILSGNRKIKLERAVAPGELVNCGDGGKCIGGFCMAK